MDDEKRNARLNRRLDIRILPLCCFVYLLNFLDRGNIGNSKVLNAETGDDLLQQTHMTADGYAITVTLFSLAYALFEVPSVRYKPPSTTRNIEELIVRSLFRTPRTGS